MRRKCTKCRTARHYCEMRTDFFTAHVTLPYPALLRFENHDSALFSLTSLLLPPRFDGSATKVQLKRVTCTKALQDGTTTMSDDTTLFEAVIDEFFENVNRLNSSAHIVLCSEFENAIVKLQRENVSGLIQEEAIAISKLILHRSQREANMNEGLSFAQRALKRRK